MEFNLMGRCPEIEGSISGEEALLCVRVAMEIQPPLPSRPPAANPPSPPLQLQRPGLRRLRLAASLCAGGDSPIRLQRESTSGITTARALRLHHH
ncbi:hypothetical protein PS1_038091 [Malus domestica]